MSINPDNILETQTHILDNFDFDILGQDVLVSIGKDSIFKKTCLKTFENLLENELEKCGSVISVLPNSDKSELIVGIETESSKITNFEFDLGYPQVFSSQEIQFIQCSSKGSYNIVLQDSQIAQLFNNNNEQVKNLQEQQSKCLYAAFSPDERFLAISCQDGFLYLYNIQNQEPSLEKKISMGKENKDIEKQKQQLFWKQSQSEHVLYISGSPVLQYVNIINNWEKKTMPNIIHKQNISIIQQLDDTSILTIDSTGHILVSNLLNQKEIFSHQYKFSINKALYNKENKVLIFSDVDLNLCFWKEFDPKSQTQQQQQQVQQQQKQVQQQYNQQQQQQQQQTQNQRIQESQQKMERLNVNESQKSQMEEEQEFQQTNNNNKNANQNNNINNSIDIEEELRENVQQLSNKDKIKSLLQDKANKKAAEEQDLQEKKQQQEQNNNKDGDNNEDENEDEFLVSGLNKKKSKKMQMDQIIGCSTQPILYSTSTKFHNSARYLANNYVGSIIARKDDQQQNPEEFESAESQMLEFEFSDKVQYQNLYIKDTYQICMAQLNAVGAILASRGYIPEDDYENENQELTDKSVLIFKHFKPQIEKTEWLMELEEGENVDSVAIGNSWVACATDLHFLRVYSMAGIQLYCTRFAKPIVTLCGYENLLVYVYHDSLPVLGCQNIKMHIYDVSQGMKLIDENTVNLGPKIQLTYFGFSEEGMLIAQDNKGDIMIYVNREWHHVNYFIKGDRKLWLAGMVDKQLLGIKLDKLEFEPSVHYKKDLTAVNLNPGISNEKEFESFDSITVKKLLLEHEIYRSQMWLKYKISRVSDHILQRYSGSVLDNDDIKKQQGEIDKSVVYFFKNLLENQQYEKAFMIVNSQIQNIDILKKCYSLCQQLQINSMANALSYIIEEKLQIARFERNQRQSNPIKQLPNSNGGIKMLQRPQQQQQQNQQVMEQEQEIQHNETPKKQVNDTMPGKRTYEESENNKTPQKSGQKQIENPFAKKNQSGSKGDCIFSDHLLDNNKKKQRNNLSLFGK